MNPRKSREGEGARGPMYHIPLCVLDRWPLEGIVRDFDRFTSLPPSLSSRCFLLRNFFSWNLFLFLVGEEEGVVVVVVVVGDDTSLFWFSFSWFTYGTKGIRSFTQSHRCF